MVAHMDIELNPNLWRRIEEERDRQDISHDAVRDRGGPSSPTMTKISGGSGTISDSSARKLEKALSWHRGSVEKVLAGGKPMPMPRIQMSDRDIEDTTRRRVARDSRGEKDLEPPQLSLADVVKFLDRISPGQPLAVSQAALRKKLAAGERLSAAEIAFLQYLAEQTELDTLESRIELLPRPAQLEVSGFVDHLTEQYHEIVLDNYRNATGRSGFNGEDDQAEAEAFSIVPEPEFDDHDEVEPPTRASYGLASRQNAEGRVDQGVAAAREMDEAGEESQDPHELS